MIESLQNVFYVVVGVLSGSIVMKNAWDIFIVPKLSIETKQSREFKQFKEEIKKELCEIKEKLDDEVKHRIEERELNRLILDGVTASLYAHREKGANGPVTVAIRKIEEYKTMKAVM